MRNSLLSFFLLFLLSTTVRGQQTLVYEGVTKDYKTALELFDKEKYGAAQKHFDRIIQDLNDSESEMSVQSEYYAALCALNLFNKDAEHLLNQFVDNHPESPLVKIAHFHLGNYNYRKRKWEKVIYWFDRVDVFDLNKEEVAEYHFKKGYSYFMLENFEEAKKLLYEIKDVDTKYTDPARYYYSHIAYQERQYQTALEGFRKLADNEKFAVVVPYYITQILYLQEKYKELLSYAPALLDTATPKRIPEISRLIGDSYYKTKQYKESIPYLEKQINNNYYAPIEDKYQLGYAYYKSGNYKGAIDVFTKISQDDNVLAQTAFYHLGDCYLKIGKKKFAQTAFQSAYKMDFDDEIKEDALFNFAVLSYELSYDPYNKSIDAFKDYIELYPKSPKIEEAYQYLVNVYMTTRNYSKAMESLESLPSLDPRLKGAYQRVAYNSAVEQFHNGEYKEAIKGFKKALKYPVDREINTQCHFWMGECFYNVKQYDMAIGAYQAFIYEPGAALQSNFNLANYNIGYAYFSNKDNANAVIWFRKYVGNKSETDTVKLSDAYLRIGDAYFLEKDYYKSEGYYGKAAELKGIDPDYALYQQAMVMGLLKQTKEKMEILKTLVKEYPMSNYLVDAWYQLGSGYLMDGNQQEAVVCFNRIITDYPNSSYVKKSLTNIGLIKYNNKENEAALRVFKRVVNDYPTYEDSKEALLAIKNIYVRLGKVDEYADFMESLSFVNVSNGELDSVMYEAAEIQYVDGKFDGAKEQFEKYLKKFESGLFALNAHFYKAECEMKVRNYDEALFHYNWVIKQPLNKFSETALLNAARINFSNHFFEHALENYMMLEKVAEYKSNIKEAKIGQMKCFFFLKNYSSAEEYARIVLRIEKLKKNTLVESYMILAKCAFAQDSLDKAMLAFDTTSAITNGQLGAESKYYMALIWYKKDSLKNAEAEIYDLVNRVPSYQYWVAKGLILLSDVYVKMGDNFQAKATLQSILDNYTGDDEILDEAEQKIANIEALENIREEEEEEEDFEIDFSDIEEEDIQRLYEDDANNKNVNNPKKEEVINE